MHRSFKGIMEGRFSNTHLGEHAVLRGGDSLPVHTHLYEVADVLERARLAAITVDREGLALQRLDDEVRHHAA